MVHSYLPLHSYSVISEDKPSHIPNSLTSDFVKRSPLTRSMVSDSATEDDQSSDFLADPPKEDPIPRKDSNPDLPPVIPVEKPPVESKPEIKTVPETKPETKAVPKLIPDTKPVPEVEPVETPTQIEVPDENPTEPKSPQQTDIEPVTQGSVPEELKRDPELKPVVEPEPELVTVTDPIIDKDPIKPPVTEKSIVDDVKTTLLDEMTTRVSLSPPSPPHPPVPVPIPDQIETTWKDEISTTVQSTASTDDSSSTSTVVIIIIALLVIIAIAIVVFFVCKRYRKKKGAGKGGKKKKLKQTNVKVTKKKPDETNTKVSAKTAKSISEMKKDGKGLKGKTVDKSATRSSSSKSTNSGRKQIPAPPLEVDSTLESDPASSPAKIEAEQSIFVCYGNKWREVKRIDSDFSFSINESPE